MTTPKHQNSQVPRSTAGITVPSARPEPEKGASPEEIEADLARTRRELGKTVEALTEKLDVKSQAREQINEAKHRIAEQTNDARQHAVTYIGWTKTFLTDEQGKPNTNAWIGVATVTATMALAIALRARR